MRFQQLLNLIFMSVHFRQLIQSDNKHTDITQSTLTDNDHNTADMHVNKI